MKQNKVKIRKYFFTSIIYDEIRKDSILLSSPKFERLEALINSSLSRQPIKKQDISSFL